MDGVLGLQYGNLKEILGILKKTYCSTIGYEFMHMSDPEEKAWIRNRIEGPEKDIKFTDSKNMVVRMLPKREVQKMLKELRRVNNAIIIPLANQDVDVQVGMLQKILLEASVCH